MDLIFLGTGAGAPTLERNVSGLALALERRWFLFDCGEGTQHRLLQTPLSPQRLQRIFISHLHGDHVFGLFGLLGSRSLAGITTPLEVVGPPGTRTLVHSVLAGASMRLKFELTFVELPQEGGPVPTDGPLEIEAIPLDHRVVTFAWWIREASAPGPLDVERARALGVPEGPQFGDLKRGNAVRTPDGNQVKPEDVLGPVQPGRTLIIAGDNRDPQSLLERTSSVQLLVHEATFSEPILAALPDDKGHSTAARVAAAAEGAGVENLVLTHFSARFRRSDGSVDTLRAEARQRYRGSLFLADDLERYRLARDGRLSPTPLVP